MASKPYLIDQPNLSLAWAAAFQAVDAIPGKEVNSLSVSFTGLSPDIEEVREIRDLLDNALDLQGMQSIHTVANTIFPSSLWRLARGDREVFYREYLENLPHYTKMSPYKNRGGTYFSRLISFDVDPIQGAIDLNGSHSINQIEFLIQHCLPRKRRSYLQAAVFDPHRDHSEAAQLGFPCLQHVSVIPDFKAGSIDLNAFYATQQLFDKAYGNFLGLARLGKFIAEESNLELHRVTCFVGLEKIDRGPTGSRGRAFREELGHLSGFDATVASP